MEKGRLIGLMHQDMKPCLHVCLRARCALHNLLRPSRVVRAVQCDSVTLD